MEKVNILSTLTFITSPIPMKCQYCHCTVKSEYVVNESKTSISWDNCLKLFMRAKIRKVGRKCKKTRTMAVFLTTESNEKTVHYSEMAISTKSNKSLIILGKRKCLRKKQFRKRKLTILKSPHQWKPDYWVWFTTSHHNFSFLNYLNCACS